MGVISNTPKHIAAPHPPLDASNAPEDRARAIIHSWLPQISADLLTWGHTGLLPEGKLQEAAAALGPLHGDDSLSIAEHWARQAALEVAAHGRT